MNIKTKEYLTNKLQKGEITWDSKFESCMVGGKKSIIDQQGKVFKIVWAYFDRELDKFNGDKKGYIHIKYKKDKIYYSVLLREVKP